MPEENSSLSRVKGDWSPLHLAVMRGDNQQINLLLQKGVNILQKDSQGFTAIHRLLGAEDAKSKTARILLAADQLEESTVQSIGLTHLHVASCLNNGKAVQKLMEKGADIEARLEQVIKDEKLAKYAGCTPLHVAMMNQSMEAIKELLQWGADIFAKKPDSISPLAQVLTGCDKKLYDLFMLLLWSDNELQQAMKVRESGLTMLHVACYALDIRKAKTLLKNGADVNARIDNDSDIWPGCTPLHVLMTRTDKVVRHPVSSNMRKKRLNVFHLLLDNGADLTVADLQQRTPLQMIFVGRNEEFDLFDLQDSILKRHLDFRVNPTNNRGLSYFHLACLINDLSSVEKFLNQGNIEVNRPIDFNSTVYAGSTPLHLAVVRRYTKEVDCQLSIVESLLNYGAKVSLKDSQGETPLHKVMRFLRGTERLSFMKKMLDMASATDVNIRNTQGKTPMELLLFNGADVEEIKLLLDHGGCINACNPTTNEGYIAIIFSLRRYNQNKRKAILSMILKSELSQPDEMGRNAIHNAVAADNMEESMEDIVAFIKELINLGCDIDQGDSFGKTALHLAVQFRNIEAVHSLLMLGADFNVVDSSGKSAFSYFFEPALHQQMYGTAPRDQELLSIFITLVQKCKLTGIEVSELNDALQMKAIRNHRIVIDSIVDDDFFDQLRAAKNVKLGPRELTLRNFFCETGAISAYPSIMPTGRKEIAAFFENIDNFQSFSQLTYLIQFQYRKAVLRLPLVASAGNALKIHYRLPDLCVRMVLMYLSNSELKNLIAAAIDDNDKQMVVDE